jgi:hypothetical protein
LLGIITGKNLYPGIWLGARISAFAEMTKKG